MRTAATGKDTWDASCTCQEARAWRRAARHDPLSRVRSDVSALAPASHSMLSIVVADAREAAATRTVDQDPTRAASEKKPVRERRSDACQWSPVRRSRPRPKRAGEARGRFLQKSPSNGVLRPRAGQRGPCTLGRPQCPQPTRARPQPPMTLCKGTSCRLSDGSWFCL